MGTPLQAQSDPSDLLSQAERSTPYLLDAAGQVRSEALAMKGLQVAAAAACRAGPASSGFRVRRLLHALATTMIANPLSPVRNAAHYATDAVLSALTVEARLSAVEALFQEGHPGVSALVIHRVAQDAQALWPRPDSQALPQEPICAALNLYKLLLIRASHTGCMPGISMMEKGALKALKGTMSA
ncbi:hypothetical protein WJX75_000460 [Coccomyxa subellipsoidea]|uniref:Uncharacterized protein n=1 Tax=Coccomyxa subellipsoidea TaxID=248742 RepID=A0ABR2YTQ6_9CHLO